MSWTPAAFVSHGAPTVALERDGYTASMAALGRRLRPAAVAVVSAHWQTHGAVVVTSSPLPRTIHDFGGFPEALYRIQYPAPGDPALAARIVDLLASAGIPAGADPDRGLDHGAWVPLRLAWPGADVPVVQISLPDAEPEELWRMGRVLSPLRERGVLLLGSGGMVHNLELVDLSRKERPPEPWAAAFDRWVAERLEARDFAALLAYRRRAPHAYLAAPTSEHFDPIFPVLGAAADEENAVPVFEGFHYGSLGMRSFELREGANPQ
ncbi:MAG TPA: class III extradiol ring-cleavage dioxygenase [Anaeromyxobacteraceae bacterium]|nr:class III extradiol ring-cleavage dioxygenase [Anaeromyxobacteraceae bacterium]